MRFDDLDQEMRRYETAHDYCVPDGCYIVTRLDGRCFTGLTKRRAEFERPFDAGFRDLMAQTVRHLMGTGFNVLLGYSQSDEISLLHHPNEQSFGRKLRKLDSVLAGEASARFSTLYGEIGVFDCRVSQLPTAERVIDYFRWRMADAQRNALNAHCHWLLIKLGLAPRDAYARLQPMEPEQRLAFLAGHGVDFQGLPDWQRAGFACYYTDAEKRGTNPTTGQEEVARRRQLVTDFNLPTSDGFGELLRDHLESA